MQKALIGILLLAAGLRAAALGQPYLGNFSSYQLISASMTRFMLREHFSGLLLPHVDFLIEGQPGLHLHYFPVASLIAALMSWALPLALEITGRLQAMFFSLGTVVLLYAIGTRLSDRRFGLIAALAYAVSPISVIYGQSFMNEAAGVFFVTLSLYAFLCSPGQKKGFWILLGIVAAGLSLITRLNSFYVFLPMLFLWIYRDGDFRVRRIFSWIALCAAACLLPLLWYGHTYGVPLTNTHVYICMFPQLGRQAPGQGLNAEFFITFAKTLATLDFTPIGLALLFCGLFLAPWRIKSNAWVLAWFFGVLLSFLMIPQKIVDHNFYTLHLIPPGCLLIAAALQWLRLKIPKALFWAVCAAALIACVGFAYGPVVRTVLPENREVLDTAALARAMIPPEAKIVAARGSANSLLYYCDRRGWDFMTQPPRQIPYAWHFRWRFLDASEKERRAKAILDPVAWLEHLREQGAEYFVAVGPQEWRDNPEFGNYLESNYRNLAPANSGRVIYDLKPAPESAISTPAK